MRTYVGEYLDGRARVLVHEIPAHPPAQEANELLAELRGLSEERSRVGDEDASYAEHREAFLARRKDLLPRTQATERPTEPVPLRHEAFHSAVGFEWGNDGAGASDLARCLLEEALGAVPPRRVYAKFVDDVVARLPADGFELPADEVAAWLDENRTLLEEQPAARGRSPSPGGSLPARGGETQADADRAPAVADPALASALVAACEAAWGAVQDRHPEVPDAVVVLGTGVERGRLAKLGHWWGGRWLADGQVRGEVLLAGEALHLPAEQVFEVLLHEAAHGLNAARGIKDASRGGRYHNANFKAAAEEVGLAAAQTPPYGWARTALRPETAERFAPTIARLDDAMRIARRLEAGVQISTEAEGERGALGEGGRAGGRGGAARNGPAQCGCGRGMRMAPTVLAAGPVLCGICGTAFESQVPERQAAAHRGRGVAERASSLTDPALAARYRSFLTGEEEPLADTAPADVEHHDGFARSVLKADGTLSGPAVVNRDRELAVGDRVVAGAPGDGLASDTDEGPPPGVPGVVVDIDPRHDELEIDCATDGRYRLPTGGPVARALGYAYAVPDTGTAGAFDLRTIELSPSVGADPASSAPEW